MARKKQWLQSYDVENDRWVSLPGWEQRAESGGDDLAFDVGNGESIVDQIIEECGG